MTVYESDLPGVGKKFEIDLDDDERLVIVIHNTGKREVFRRVGDEDSQKLFELSDRLARQIGTILEGAYFQPIATDAETMLGEDSVLEWVKVTEDSELDGHTLEELDIRGETRASIVAIQRNGEIESNPGPEATIERGDMLVVLGTREACQAMETVAAGDASLDDVAVEDAEAETTADGDENGA